MTMDLGHQRAAQHLHGDSILSNGNDELISKFLKSLKLSSHAIEVNFYSSDLVRICSDPESYLKWLSKKERDQINQSLKEF